MRLRVSASTARAATKGGTKGAVALASVGLLAFATACSSDESDATFGSSSSSSSSASESTADTEDEGSGPNPTMGNRADDGDNDDSEDAEADSSTGTSFGSDFEGTPVGTNHPDNDTVAYFIESIPEGAFPGAGETLAPSERQPIETQYESFYYFVDSTGKIGCQIHAEFGAMCGSMGEKMYHDGDYHGVVAYPFYEPHAGSAPHPIAQTGANVYFTQEGGDAMQLSPGDAVYEDPIACGETEEGVTCWNTSTGFGVFVDRDLNAQFFRANS